MSWLEWSPRHPLWVYAVLALALVVFLALAWRTARVTEARRWRLLFPRVALFVLLFLVSFNLVQVTETRPPPRRSEVLYLVDGSRSMTLDRPVSRLDRVKQFLAESERLVPPDSGPRRTLYLFGDELRALSSAEELRSEDDTTHLIGALERLPAHFVSGRPASVVIFSDGKSTESAGFAELAASYRRLGIPLHAVPVGDQAKGDVAIQDVIAPREVPSGARVPVRVMVRSRGFQGQRSQVLIRSLDTPARPPVASLPITLGTGIQTVELLLDSTTVGRRLLVEIPPITGELLAENNRVPFSLGVRKSKIRVIYMEGTGGNEYRWVRDALVEDPNIECLAMELNNQYASQPTLHRVGNPSQGYPKTREELFQYDVVICSDISRASFSQQQLDWTVELVAQRGGGFAMVGGNTSFGAGFWDRTVWDGLIPADMSGQAESPGRGTSWGTPFRVRVPREVEGHPIWRLDPDPVRNRAILDRMPAFTGTNLIQRLKPAATALGLTDRPMPNVGTMPVFSCETYGQGRTFALSSDTTVDWGQFFERDWGENGDNRYFRKFWRNVVTWLAENSIGSNRRLRLTTDKVIYRPGEPILLSARAFDDKQEETTRYRLTARLRPETANAAPLQEIGMASPGSGKPYSGELRAPPLRSVPGAQISDPGVQRVLRVEVAAHEGERQVASATLDVQLLDDPPEFEDPQPSPATLDALASGSGGRLLHNASELAAVLSEAPVTQSGLVVARDAAWDRSWVWLLMIGFLGGEWILRRRSGLA